MSKDFFKHDCEKFCYFGKSSDAPKEVENDYMYKSDDELDDDDFFVGEPPCMRNWFV